MGVVYHKMDVQLALMLFATRYSCDFSSYTRIV